MLICSLCFEKLKKRPAKTGIDLVRRSLDYLCRLYVVMSDVFFPALKVRNESKDSFLAAGNWTAALGLQADDARRQPKKNCDFRMLSHSR